MAKYTFYVQGVNITIDAPDKSEALARLERIKADYAAELDTREAHCEASGTYTIRREALDVAEAARGYWHASFPNSFPVRGCPLGRGATEAGAVADLVERTQSESKISIHIS